MEEGRSGGGEGVRNSLKSKFGRMSILKSVLGNVLLLLSHEEGEGVRSSRHTK